MADDVMALARRYIWDLFLAHAGADRDRAEALYDLVSSSCRTFLDSRCLEPGDDWDEALANAQRSSRVTAVLLSPHTGRAFYQREEVAAAIAMARDEHNQHRVIPVYLRGWPTAQDHIPYGLRLKQGIAVERANDLGPVAEKLVAAATQASTRRSDAASTLPKLQHLQRETSRTLFRSEFRAVFRLTRAHEIRVEVTRGALSGAVAIFANEEQLVSWKSGSFAFGRGEGHFTLDGVDCRWERFSAVGLTKLEVFVGDQRILSV